MELRTILTQDHGIILVHFTSTDNACIPCVDSNSGIPFVIGREHWVHPFLRVSWATWTVPPAGLPVGNLAGLPLLVVFSNGKAVKEYVGYSSGKEEEVVRLLRPFNHGQAASRAVGTTTNGPHAASLRFGLQKIALGWGQTYLTSVEARNEQGKPMVPVPALKWSTNAENIVAVDDTGRIHSIRRGQAVITARSGTASASIAVDVTGFVDLSTSDTDTTCAITDSRLEIDCWGNAVNNRIFAKYAANASSYAAPVQIQQGEIPPGAHIASLAIGKELVCTLTEAGRAYCWGGSAQRAVPTLVQAGDIPASAKISSLAVAAGTACAIATDSQFYCWGATNSMPIGAPAAALDKPTKMTLGEIPPNEGLTSIGISPTVGCIIASGDAYCWLPGGRPQLVSPGELPASGKVTTLSVSDAAVCALGVDGRAYCFGKTGKGSPVWKAVPFEVKLKQLSVGGSAADVCVIGDDHHIYCGGHALATDVTFQRVVCAPKHCAAISEDGRIYSWGASQSEAELGRRINPKTAVPRLINAP